MNIWIVNHYAIPATQSGGTRHYSLGHELARRGHEVSILASDFHHAARSRVRPAATDADQGVRFRWISTPAYSGNGPGRIRNMLSFARQIWRDREAVRVLGVPDIVLGSSPHPFAALAARWVAQRYRAPFVLEIRDLWPDSLVKVAGVSTWHPLVILLRWLERYLYRAAHAIVTVLPAAAEHIVARGGHRDRIFWIPNGVDFHLAPPASPRDDGAPFTVVYAGNHGSANALDSVLDAARVLRDHQDPVVHFRFIGEGPERSRLRERAAVEGITNARFDDPVPKHRIYEELHNADVLIATTRNIDLYSHGLSFNKLFDYFAVGRPIVFGADTPDNPVAAAGAGEIVAPEDSGAMAEAILRIARLSPADRWELGRRGRRYAEENYDIRKLADRLEGAFTVAEHAASARRKARPGEYL